MMDALYSLDRMARRTGEGGEPLPRCVPDVERMLAWLTSRATCPDGHVVSWVNPDHKGYPYPEAAGLLLSLLAVVEPRPSTAREAIATRLGAELQSRTAVGRDGVEYVFDSAMVLHGLHVHVKRGGCDRPELVHARTELYGFLVNCIHERAALGRGSIAPVRWSTTWGCHLLKLVLALDTHAGSDADTHIRALLDSLLQLFRGGRFVTHHGSEQTYVHASCYALEGLLRLQLRGDSSAGALLDAGARWLTQIQLRDGSLPAWHDGVRGWGPNPADIVAQSVRLWSAIDRQRFAEPIARALAYLASLQTASGGLRYHRDSADVNTWSTTFATQAVLWATSEAKPGELV